MASHPIQSLNSVYTFRHSISLFSSIEGIFSCETGDGTRTLQDLIVLLQPLHLGLYRGTEMHDTTCVGEGSSYRVFRCHYARKELVAAKTMKLPLKETVEEKKDFRRRILCLIKDIEVMHHPPLAQHENILRLLGYGWNLSEDSALPFLVTEYADQGTLRELLQKKEISIPSRLKLCGNVASGLHAMHMCGVSHGDLKLENVLVFHESELYGSMAEQYSAKLSDFGQSCVNSSGKAVGSAQLYRGTIGYMPPELYQTDDLEVSFPKCDIWALALLLWETLAGGSRYTENLEVESLLRQQTSRSSRTKESDLKEDENGQEIVSRPGYGFFLISEQLCQLAVDFVEEDLRHKISPMSRTLVKQIFRLSLQKDPIKRCGDVSRLPFTSSKHSNSTSTVVDSSLIERPNVQSKWSFEDFTPHNLRMSRLPHTTKAHMLADAKETASSGAGESAASATLYIGLAYGIGFGVEESMETSLSWITKSAAQGSPAASLLLEVTRDHEKLQQKVLHALKGTTEDMAHSAGHGACRFTYQDPESAVLSSFSSTDGCNALHYLSLFEGLTNSDSNSGGKGVSITKRADFKSEGVLHERRLQDPPSYLQSEKERYGYRKGKVSDLSLRVQRLSEVVNHLGPQFIRASTAKVHHLYRHFPMTLSGTPLSFAITLDCREATEALLCDVQSFGEVSYKALGLEAAVSCHRSEIFSLIWSICVKNGKEENLINAIFRPEKRLHLIAALAIKSSLERTVMHGQKRSSAQTGIIKNLISSLYDLVSERYHGHRPDANAAFTRLVSEEVIEILELGDLGIATELRRTIRSRPIDDPYSQDVFNAAMHLACSGYFNLSRSKEFVEFARDCRQDLSLDFQVLKTLIDYRSEALFRSCVEGGMQVDGCDEHGQNLLHYMISTSFYTCVSLSFVISRGVDPNHPNSEGQTPLHLAAKLGLPLVMNDLLANGAVPLFVDKHGASILVYAVAARNVTIVAKVLEALETTLQDARSDISSSKVLPKGQHLFSSDAFISVFEYESIDQSHMERRKTVLHIAASNGDTEIVKLLLLYGASADMTDMNGNTALHHAVLGSSNRSTDAVSSCHLLIKALPEKLPRNKDGETPLHLAVQWFEGDSLDRLLNCFIRDYGCVIDVQNARGETSLHKAASQISVSSVTTLLSFGAAINQKDSRGWTATHHFAHNAYFVWRHASTRDKRIKRMLEILVEAGADLMLRDDTQGSGGYTAMEYAAINGNYALFRRMYEIASRCLESPHNQEVPRQWMSSAWSLSVAEEQWHMVRQLLLDDPSLDADLSLLKWPKGVRLLKYAVAVTDLDLLSRYQVCTFGSLKEPPTARLSSSQINAWEGAFECTEIHKGEDPLHEIFEFMMTLDAETKRAYFTKANRERALANEIGFRWETLVDQETLYSWDLIVAWYDKTRLEGPLKVPEHLQGIR